MSAFEALVFEVRDMIEPPRERFYDEADERPERPEFWGCCGNCDEFTRCDIPGHEEVGWCAADHEFRKCTDPDECD